MGRSMDVVDSRPLQHRESRFRASNPNFPFVHEQTTPAALRTGWKLGNGAVAEFEKGRALFFNARPFKQVAGHHGNAIKVHRRGSLLFVE